MLTPANGSYKNNIIIRETDDTYIFIKNYRVILLKPTDFNAFDTIVKMNPMNNIIVDGRLTGIIYYGILTQRDNILIYDVIDRKISTIYAYVSDLYKVRLSQLSLNSIVIWAHILYIDTLCLKGCLSIHPNELLRYIISNNCSGKRLTFNYIIDNINNRSNDQLNKKLLKEIHDYLLSIIQSFNEHDYNVKPIKNALLNSTHIRLSLEVLYSNHCVIEL